MAASRHRLHAFLLSAVLALGVGLGSAGCVETSYWAIDTPDEVSATAQHIWPPVAPTAKAIYRFRNTPYFAKATPDWTRPFFPTLFEPDFFLEQAYREFGAGADSPELETPATGWQLRLLLLADNLGGASFGICAVLPCWSIGNLEFELRALALPLAEATSQQQEFSTVYVCSMGRELSDTQCDTRAEQRNHPREVYWKETIPLPAGARQFSYRRAIYRRAKVFFPWNGLWNDPRSGRRDTYDGAYQRVVTDMLAKLSADLQQAGILVKSESD